MSLANLQIRNAVVHYVGADDQTFDIVLYGLSANDIAGLILSQLDNIEEIFSLAEASGLKNASDMTDSKLLEVGQRLMVQMPELIARVIAYSAHEPDQWDKVRHLPVPVQTECVKKLAVLTFNDEAGFRDFVGNVVAALRSARNVVPQSLKNDQAAIDSSNGG